MSKYEWERGTIIIPTAQWAGFKKTIREAWDKALDADLATAESLIQAVLTANKGKRGVNWREAVDEESRKTVSGGYPIRSERPLYKFEVLSEHFIERNVVPDAGKRPVRLKKKDLGYATRKTMSFNADDGCISFVDARHSVEWSVQENNHAVENARGSYMGNVFFSALGKIEWTRGSGGTLVGNDENNRDSESVGGGGNYDTDRFGPLGDRDLQARSIRRRMRVVGRL